MTTLHVVLCGATGAGGAGPATLPILDSRAPAEGMTFESETLSGADTSTTTVPSQDGPGLVWDVTAGAADKWVAFGAVPNPTQDPRFFMQAGSQRTFRAFAGDKCGTVDA
jgi:hypothetical protein